LQATGDVAEIGMLRRAKTWIGNTCFESTKSAAQIESINRLSEFRFCRLDFLCQW